MALPEAGICDDLKMEKESIHFIRRAGQDELDGYCSTSAVSWMGTG